jgi:hypothetical protein
VFLSLILPIVLSAVALFVASFLSWMVIQLHEKDWLKLNEEDAFMAAVRDCAIPEGSYMFPRAASAAEMKTEAFGKKYDTGPRGVLTVLPKANMGVNLGLTFGYFLAVSAGLGLLAALAFAPGAGFGTVFGFVFVAGVLAFLAAMVQHAIWFRGRITGHVVESVAYAAIAAGLFAAFWPAA